MFNLVVSEKTRVKKALDNFQISGRIISNFRKGLKIDCDGKISGRNMRQLSLF